MASVTIQMTDTDKKAFKKFCLKQGLSVSRTFNLLAKKVLKEKRLPFEIGEPNEVTVAAMREGDKIIDDPNVPGYTDLKKMWADLKK